MFPCRYGRRNVVNRCSVVNGSNRFPLLVGVGLLVQILVSGREALFVFECGGWVTSPRPISTGRLGIAAVHLRPINPVVCGWPYPI